jgi:hypothetical protein
MYKKTRENPCFQCAIKSCITTHSSETQRNHKKTRKIPAYAFAPDRQARSIESIISSKSQLLPQTRH